MSKSLETEIAFFDANMGVLCQRARELGKDAVLVHDREVVDFFSSVEEAAKEGYQRFPGQPFLARSCSQATKKLVLASIF